MNTIRPATRIEPSWGECRMSVGEHNLDVRSKAVFLRKGH